MRALGYFLNQPSHARLHAERRAVTRLSLASWTATHLSYTPGETLNPADMADRLRSIADDLDAIGDVSVMALDFMEVA